MAVSTVPWNDRLIFALDVPSAEQAMSLVETLGDQVHFYKIGLELAMKPGYFELLDWLVARGNKVFADLKLYDVPATVGRAVRQLADSGATFLTVHGNSTIMEAAAENKGALKILCVTVLTSLDQRDLAEMGYSGSVDDLVVSRAKGALAARCDGVIASGLEAPRLRQAVGDDLIIVTPGIRPAENRPADDQKRVVTVGEAFRNGADHIVVGRPIRNAADPAAAAAQIRKEIVAALAPDSA